MSDPREMKGVKEQDLQLLVYATYQTPPQATMTRSSRTIWAKSRPSSSGLTKFSRASNAVDSLFASLSSYSSGSGGRPNRKQIDLNNLGNASVLNVEKYLPRTRHLAHPG
ncbi:hypothetical protein ACEPAH_1408 [Sanghuangporus vaninii]